MFCSKCEIQIFEDVKFCGKCGNKIAQVQNSQPPTPFQQPQATYAPATMPDESQQDIWQPQAIYTPVAIINEQPQKQEAIRPVSPLQNKPLGNDLIAEAQYKGNGESAKFYSDHVEFAGNIIHYSDIEELDTKGVTSRTTFAIIFQSDFSGHIGFVLKNGQKLKIPLRGFSIYGIGTTRSAKKRFSPLFTAAYNSVAKAMAVEALARIKKGETVSITGMDINCEGAIYKRLFKKEPIYISKQNFGACVLDGYYVRVLDKNGKKLFMTSDDFANALLLPYVMTTLFTS